MKKMIKKLVAVMMMGVMVTTPVFAKDGDLYWEEDISGINTIYTMYREITQNGIVYLQNHVTGELRKKAPIKNGGRYELREIGNRYKVNVILKNGVAMVAADELAEAFGLSYDQLGMYIYFSTDTLMSELKIGEYPSLTPTNVLRVCIEETVNEKKNAYEVETSESELVGNSQGGIAPLFIKKKGMLKTPIQIINGKIYVPAREAIELINEAETEITYDGKTNTITFVQLREWYKMYPNEEL